jgi:hypothetical protein
MRFTAADTLVKVPRPFQRNASNFSTKRNDIVSAEQFPVTFTTVLTEELKAIRMRRRRYGLEATDGSGNGESSGNGDGSGEPQVDDIPHVDRLEQVRREALGENLVGLAFSGGGIRSATFNLGLLQGLADFQLLKHFDYLSTVSGGGYIGSWLATWIKREGCAENVERQLQSTRVQQAEAERCGLQRGQVFDADPEPIHHLRSYSNYLTPRMGLLSADAWGLAAIYLRNLLLNLLVLVPLLLGLIISERLLLMVFILTIDPQSTGPWEQAAWIGGQAIFAVMLVLVFLWIHRSITQIRECRPGPDSVRSYRLERSYLHRYIMIPLLTLGVLSTWLAHAHFQWFSDPTIEVRLKAAPWSIHLILPDEVWAARLLAGFAMAVMVGAFHMLAVFDRVQRANDLRLFRMLGLRLVRVALGLLVGFAGGVLLYEVFGVMHVEVGRGQHHAILALTFGPPLFLATLIFIAFLQVGIISRLWSESIREWWASLCGAGMIYLCAWIAIFGVSIWGPWVVLTLEQKLQGISAFLGTGWIATVAGGLMAGRSATHGSTSRLKRAFIRIVPAVFLIGLIILTSFVTDYFVPVWGFAKSPEAYLDSVKQVNIASHKAELLLQMAATAAVLFAFTAFVSSRVDVNTFSLNALYRNRLVRCYLGASRPKTFVSDCGSSNRGAPTNVVNCSPRSANPITGFDPSDDFALAKLRPDAGRQTASRRRAIERQIHEAESQRDCLVQAAWCTGWLHRIYYRWKISLLQYQLAGISNENDYVGPVPILSTALNLVGGDELAWQERMAESFALTPLYCGSRTTGYVPTETYSGGISVGEAVAISGAAVSPNMGYHSTSRPVTSLLTIFNMRLGAWLGNPRRGQWNAPGPKGLLRYLKNELFGLTNADQEFVYLSDGGHFENLGLYELIRRRCRYIVVSDSGADPTYNFDDLAGLIRKVRIDFGIRVQIDGHRIAPQADSGLSPCHVVVGKIYYGDVDDAFAQRPASTDSPSGLGELPSKRHLFRPENNEGLLVYIKPSITGDESQDIINYRASHPQFPHEPTTDQWFSESQFESYRNLGWHIARKVFAPAVLDQSTGSLNQMPTQTLFEHLFQEWHPSVKHFLSTLERESRLATANAAFSGAAEPDPRTAAPAAPIPGIGDVE